MDRSPRLSRSPWVVAAAVLALVAVVGCSSDEGASPPAPASTGAARTTPPAPDQVTVRDWVGGLPDGPAPRIEYQAGLTFVAPNGTERTSRWPNYLAAFVPFAGGYLALADGGFEGAGALHVLDAELQATTTTCTQSPPALSADGTRVWWGTSFCPEVTSPDLATIRSAPLDDVAATTARVIPAEEEAYLAVLGPVDASSGADAEVAYGIRQLSPSGGERPPQVRVLGPDGDRLLPLEHGLDAATTGLVAGTVGRDLVVVDAATGQETWRVREPDSAASFSPDGRYLATDGNTVYDARSGRVVARLDPVAAISGPVWEDADHLLVAVRGGAHEAAIIRYDLAGDAEVALDWRDAAAEPNPPHVGFEVVPWA